jgi:hypothetical protein
MMRRIDYALQIAVDYTGVEESDATAQRWSRVHTFAAHSGTGTPAQAPLSKLQNAPSEDSGSPCAKLTTVDGASRKVSVFGPGARGERRERVLASARFRDAWDEPAETLWTGA